MLEVNNLECVRGDRSLFRDINFSLEAGGMMQVHGANGSGKTSLLRLLCGLAAPAQGQIRWCGTDIHSLNQEYHRAMTYVGHLSAVKDDLTAIENVRISSALASVEIDRGKALEVLQRMGLDGHEWLPAKLLSQGQRRRVALARLLICGTALWILDEPLTALDSTAVKMVESLLAEHLEQGGMVVITTHLEINIAPVNAQSLVLP